MKNKFKILSKFLSSITILALLLVMVAPGQVMAASVTSFSVLLSREKASTLANHTVTFTTPTGIASGATLILTYNNSTSIPAALDFEDIDIKDDGVDRTLVSGAPGADVQVVRTSSTVITFTNGTTVFAAASVIEIQIGTHATFGVTGVEQITNGTAGTTTLVLSGTFGDSGTASMPIIDDDQVSVSATVNQSITFDLDTSVADGETGTPYTVALGTITTTDSRVSGSTDSINMIIAEGDTNASGGMVVTVRNANGANGLASTSVPADDIDSADGDIIDGTENYGLCVITAGLTGFSIDTAYTSTDCATNSETNDIEGLTTAGENILNSAGAPLASGHAEISVNAAISGTTVAHTDYTDTLTFIATGTF